MSPAIPLLIVVHSPVMGGLGVNAVPIVGQPLAYGIGVIVLIMVGLSPIVARFPVTLVHEGAHMFANLATLRGNDGWYLKDSADGETWAKDPGGWLAQVIVTIVGYAAPPLLGLGAAALIARGNPWTVLIATIFLSVLAVALSRNGLAFVIPGAIVIGVGWALLAGPASLQAGLAVGVAWLLLLGGLLRIFRILNGRTGDGDALAKLTLVPNVVWNLGWLFVGLVALIVGGQLLLRPGYLDL